MSRRPATLLLGLVLNAHLASGCALGPWYGERAESKFSKTEKVVARRPGSPKLSLSRQSVQLEVRVVEPTLCEVRGVELRTQHVFERRDYTGMLALQGTLAVAGNAIALLTPSSDLSGQSLVAWGFVGLPFTIVVTVELLRSQHREIYRESEAKPYGYTRRCPSRVLSSILVEVVLPDGTKQRAHTDAEGIARFTVDPKQSVTVRVEGVADQVSPATASPDGASE